MPAYSFKERFCPMILDQSKTHTIRDIRKGNSKHAKEGDPVMLYFGMRTKYCYKLGDGTCLYTLPIIIYKNEIFVADNKLDYYQREYLSWCDGFRPTGSSYLNPEGSFDLMIRYWLQNGGLSYERRIIYWKDFKPAAPAGLITKINE